MGSVDVSVIVTAHHEGRLAHRTMRSLYRSVEYAQNQGASIEVVIVMDRPDKATEDYFLWYRREEIRRNTIIEKVDFGDPGLSRNYGVQCSRGTYVAMLDADDLFGKDWLHKALVHFESHKEDIILHPEYQIYFGEKTHIFHQMSSTDANFKVANLFENNYWTIQCIARRNVFLKHAYGSTSQEYSGFGYEDWHFNCETLAEGINHSICPETVAFIRAKKPTSSLLSQHNHRGVARPTRLFDPKDAAHLQTTEPVTKEEDAPHRLRQFLGSVIFLTFKMFPGLYRAYLRIRWLGTTVDAESPGQHVPKRVLPDWLIAEWKEIHSIEPQLFPETSLTQTMPFYNVPDSRLAWYYKELCRLSGENVSHIFLVPWLKTGGSDIVTLNYVEALVNNAFARGIVVISTENQDSPWASRLSDKARFIEFGKMCAPISFEEQQLLLAKFLLQLGPQVIHNINSMVGFFVFQAYGKVLSLNSALYASSFCVDITEEGRSVGPAFSHLPECFDYLKAVLGDNERFLRTLHELYSFEESKLCIHYQPVKIPMRRSPREGTVHKRRLDVLWAGRLDRQKRPDVLIDITRACQDLPFKFHVYGSPVLNADSFTETLKSLRNVAYYGPFDGFASLPHEDFDVYLYTSQYDGLPIILLEAASSQIPIIASDVGGVSELVIHGKTGFLVSPCDAVDEFVKYLKIIGGDKPLREEIVNNAYELVCSRHSWSTFVQLVKETPGYVSSDTNESSLHEQKVDPSL